MKQISRILDNVNVDLGNIKLVKCLAVHNEEDWIEFNLKNNYEEFDIIRVVEGAVEGRPLSTPEGHSTDSTLDKIKNFPDPDNKIELYTIDRPFKSLEEQKQLFLEFASEGEWLFIVDCDEFYMEGDIERVRSAIHKYPKASEFIPTFLHFYRDFFHLKAPHPEWQMQHQRIIRYREGMRYHTHPVATDAAGQCTYFTPQYQPDRFTIPNLYIYHYGHAKGIEFHRMKHEFYKSELEKFKLKDGTNASDKFDEKFIEFVERKEPLDTILHYDGLHPLAMRDHPQREEKATNTAYYAQILDGGSEYRIHGNSEIKNWKENDIYGREKLPNIALLMLAPWQQMTEYYNVCEV